MKLSQQREGDVLRIQIFGEVEVESCTCLRNFWEMRVEGSTKVRVELADADCEDGAGTAELARLIIDLARGGADVEVVDAPQLLAHNLYRTGDLQTGSTLRLTRPRLEEPTA